MQARVVQRLEEDIACWRAMISGPMRTADELAAGLNGLYAAVHDADFASYDVAAVRAAAPALIEELFDLGLALRDRLPEWRQHGLLNARTAVSVRDAIRVVRYTADIVGEVAEGYARLAPGETTLKAFTGGPHNTLLHPATAAGRGIEFRSGDVLMMRGQLHNSAAIARIGDVDSQFSHVSMVYVDRHNRPWVVESLIEEGAIINSLDDALSHGLGRAVLFRHRDSALAAQAASHIHERVMTSRRPYGRHIPYDFTMRPKGYDSLFCSELVRQAYDMASAGKVMLPTHPTRLDMKNRDFFDRIGVTAQETFAPGDMEIEPGFEVVAEWRDYRVTPTLRMQDFMMSRLFDWMDQHGYVFEEDAGIRVIAMLGRISSWLPDSVKTMISHVVPKVPSNMMTVTIGTIAMLHKSAEPILQQLLALEGRHIAATGLPMHPSAVVAELERIRAAGAGRLGYLVLPR